MAISLAIGLAACPAVAADEARRCGDLPAPVALNGGRLVSVYVGATLSGYDAGRQIATAAERWIAFTAGD
jgi:hypothetical protein